MSVPSPFVVYEVINYKCIDNDQMRELKIVKDAAHRYNLHVIGLVALSPVPFWWPTTTNYVESAFGHTIHVSVLLSSVAPKENVRPFK